MLLQKWLQCANCEIIVRCTESRSTRQQGNRLAIQMEVNGLNRNALDVDECTPAQLHAFLAVNYLTVFGIGTFGDDRGAMLEAPPQQCLSYCLTVLSCNVSNRLVLHCTSLLQLGWTSWAVAVTCQTML